MLQLLDTARREVGEVVPAADGTVGLYVCGPTVYGPPHVGHGRMALVYDILRRYLEYRGSVVEHVMNVTDIDDKIINRSLEEGRSAGEIAEESEQQWWAGMDLLGVQRPRHVTHATAFVPQMITLVGELLARDVAYVTSSGVYLSVAAVPGYGLLAHQSLDDLRVGARVDPGEDKRSPPDFALWKAAKPGEPSWRAPFGDGRPGWHTECVAMSLEVLGDGFSLHGGGQDLIFPHHENERAQAVALGRPFARQWVHSGLVVAGGDKMSKSLGNILPIADLGEIADPRAYRLLVLRSHYRSPLEVAREVLEDAGRQVERVDAFARRIDGAAVQPAPGSGGEEVAAFEAAMDDDLDTPRALAGLFEAIRHANSLLDRGDAAGAVGLGRRVLALLAGLGLEVAGASSAPAEVVELATRRVTARRGGDYALADALREGIERLGWRVEDTRSGFELHRKGTAG